jgi:hypothetical protein
VCRRSIWRETKLLLLLLTSGFENIDAALEQFADISRRLQAEKRRTKRKLQMSNADLC